MKNLIALLVIFTADFQSLLAQGSNGNEVVGIWKLSDKSVEIEIVKRGHKYFERIIRDNNPERKDENNPDQRLRSSNLLTLEILKYFEVDGDNE
ncbi:MAG: DUF2147 domain-containing protein [Flavobacteriales bacterium]|nr:DUF2147 domain-containing protein [Flavobacteriales bacterium]